MKQKFVAMDGNEAAAHVAHALSEVIAIYPITPSSGMGEICDEKSAVGQTNIWDTVPDVSEMQSEGGASGAIHGALATGALCTTFTASQGLLLMIPNMHKIAAELLPTVFHVSARSLACQALSIFGDHSDVMSVRNTGFGLIASGGVQEVMDLALIAHAASLEAGLPFVHFFDGFRTSHELQNIYLNEKDVMAKMVEDKFVIRHRKKGLSPDHPMMSGTSQNPDVYFQGRETVNKYYDAAPAIVEKCMKKFEDIVGRKYELFQYYGAPDAEKVIVLMGSATEAAEETVQYLMSQGEKVGVVKVRLYRPFSKEHLAKALPATTKYISVLDRTKEPGSIGEPLYLDIVDAIDELLESGDAPFKTRPLILGGRYGLSSKEFTPGMIKAVYDNLTGEKKNHFTIGIEDDVTNTSLKWNEELTKTCSNAFQAMFWGLGSDGTVGANKNTIKIISESTDKYVQGYFVYDSKKAGARTTSHLRFCDQPIKSTYLCSGADFVACHNYSFIERYDMLKALKPNGTFLIASPHPVDEVWAKLPHKVQCQLAEKNAKLYTINAIELAKELGLGARINTIMQSAFFKVADIIPLEKAIELMKLHIKKSYGSKGEDVLKMNYAGVDAGVERVHEVKYDAGNVCGEEMPPVVPDHAPDFVKDVTAKIIRLEGDDIKVSQMPDDGQWPTATTQYEKRNIAIEIPVWEPDTCVQCGQCSLICPHASIRMKIYEEKDLSDAPKTFKSADAKTKAFEGRKATVQVAPEDCTGCGICVVTCPAKSKETGKKAINMQSQFELRADESENWDFFLNLPETDPSLFKKDSVKGSQLLRPLFEFSGACAGCGETPYVKLMTQLFGDRMVIANATGCSSIYGGNLPTTPYCKNADGRGPAWTNSLFEDNAEIGYGFKLTADRFRQQALEIVERASYVPADLKKKIAETCQCCDENFAKMRVYVDELKKLAIANKDDHLESLADYLVKKSIWVLGGDGWAYDIGYGGLDHVLAMGRDVNVLVLDTEVYSNTGGQSSKATGRGSTAKFAFAGKGTPKKDLGALAQTYGYIYVAQIAMGANPAQTVKAFNEAESYDGPSIIIAYSPCIAHGIDMTRQTDEQKLAVDSGHWLLYRYDPRLVDEGKNPLQLDSKEPKIPVKDFMMAENRYRVLNKIDAERAEMLAKLAQFDVDRRWNVYKQMAEMDFSWAKK